jgi:16S rRNA (adenine1518-N6/adenine1519-N6)-dimethyltransferase
MHPEPKKRLGQNFLLDKNIQRKILACLDLKSSDIVLEIGSGRGELTSLCALGVDKIYALEIDTSLCQVIKMNLKCFSNIKVINRDILKFNLKNYFKNDKNKLKVIGNIPYYISSPILEHLIKFRNRIDTIFITVQREFAARLVALAGSKDYGSLSCFVQYYLEPKILLNIKKTCFFPVPKVDSCLVRLKVRQEPNVFVKNESSFFKIIRAAFNQRRKTLRNSLSGIILPDKLSEFFHTYGIDINIRPEDLTLADFANLANSSPFAGNPAHGRGGPP